MRRYLFTCILVAVIFLNYFEGYGQQFKAGLTGGLSTSQIDGDGYAGFNKAGILFGGFVNTEFSENARGQFEIIYINKGSRKPAQPDQGVYDTYLIQLNYIDIPILYQYQLDKFLFEGGPSIGALIKSRESDDRGEIPDPTFDFKRYEIALNLGASYFLSDNMFVTWRYSRSFLPIANKSIFTRYSFFGGSYNTVLSFSLHYQFTGKDDE